MAVTLWVDGATGNDLDSGLTQELAKLTIAGALSVAAVGDTINIVNSTTYTEPGHTITSKLGTSYDSWGLKLRGCDASGNPALTELRYTNNSASELYFIVGANAQYIIFEGFYVNAQQAATDATSKAWVRRDASTGHHIRVQYCYFHQRQRRGGAILNENASSYTTAFGEMRYCLVENQHEDTAMIDVGSPCEFAFHHNVIFVDEAGHDGVNFVGCGANDQGTTNKSIYNNTVVIYSTSTACVGIFVVATDSTATGTPVYAIHSNVVANFQAAAVAFRHMSVSTSPTNPLTYSLTLGYTLFVNPNNNAWGTESPIFSPWVDGSVFESDGQEFQPTDAEIASDPFVDKSTPYNWDVNSSGYVLPLPGDLHLTTHDDMALDGGPPGALDALTGTIGCAFEGLEATDCKYGIELRSTTGSPVANNTFRTGKIAVSSNITDPQNFEMIRLIDDTNNEGPYGNVFETMDLSALGSQNIGRRVRCEGHDNLFIGCDWRVANVSADADITIGSSALPGTSWRGNMFIGGPGLDDIIDTSTSREFISSGGTGANFNERNVFIGSSASWGATGDTEASLLTIDNANGRVGIGTATPACLLSVDGSTCTIDLNVSGAYTGIDHIKDDDADTFVRTMSSGGADNDTVAIETSSVERMTVNSTGVVRVNPGGTSTGDFIVQGDNNASLVFIDASEDSIGLGAANAVANSARLEFTTNIVLRTPEVFHTSQIGGGPSYIVSAAAGIEASFEVNHDSTEHVRFASGPTGSLIDFASTGAIGFDNGANQGTISWGDPDTATITYNGTDLAIDPRASGSGDVLIPRDDTALALGAASGGDARIYWNGAGNQLYLDPKAASGVGGVGSFVLGGGTVIDGEADEIQLRVDGYQSGQNEPFFRIRSSGGTNFLSVLGSTGGLGKLYINEANTGTADFVVDGQNDDNLIAADVSQDNVGIGRAPASAGGRLQVEEATADIPAVFIRSNIAATALAAADVYAGIDLDIDYAYNGVVTTDIPVLIRGRLDLVHTAGTNLATPQLVDLRWTGDSGTATGDDTTGPWHALVTTARGANAPSAGYFRFKASNTGSPSGAQIALNSLMVATNHTGEIVGYQGSSQSVNSGGTSTGAVVGVDGFVTPTSTVPYCIAVRGNLSNATALTAEKRMGFWSTGHILLSSTGSVWVRSSSTTNPGAFASGHLTHTAGGQGYFEGAVEVDGKLWADGDLQHAGTNLGFYGVTAIARPSAYTQTFSTADKTHAAFTSADIGAFTGGATGFVDAAERDNIRTQFNALRADVDDLKRLANSIIDDLQALGLVQ